MLGILQSPQSGSLANVESACTCAPCGISQQALAHRQTQKRPLHSAPREHAHTQPPWPLERRWVEYPWRVGGLGLPPPSSPIPTSIENLYEWWVPMLLVHSLSRGSR